MSLPLKHLFQSPILNLRTKNKQERDLAVFGPLNIIKNIFVMKSKGERKYLCLSYLSRSYNKMPDDSNLGKSLSWLPVHKYRFITKEKAGGRGNRSCMDSQKAKGVGCGVGEGGAADTQFIFSFVFSPGP